MQLADLLPVLHDLPRSDKFRALQFLTTELAQDEAPGLLTGAACPVWSPHDAVDAAAPVNGLYSGKLDNAGETLTLVHPAAGPVMVLRYNVSVI